MAARHSNFEHRLVLFDRCTAFGSRQHSGCIGWLDIGEVCVGVVIGHDCEGYTIQVTPQNFSCGRHLRTCHPSGPSSSSVASQVFSERVIHKL